MHSQLSLLLIFTAFSAIFFLSGSASVLLTTSPPSSALATTGKTSTSSNPPATALLPRAPEQQSDAPFARCRCRALGMTFYDCLFYQILNWPTEQNFVRRLHDELRKCGHLDFGLRKYYIPERESGLGAFVYFRLPFVHKDRCWRRAIARALGTTGVECSFSYAMRDDPQAWWEDMVRANRRHA
ncbi:hypothetical protein MMC31_007324, partial [Peltigera leucophlebia]|nr:hypothetical protein [Peltigera leucophlebia]